MSSSRATTIPQWALWLALLFASVWACTDDVRTDVKKTSTPARVQSTWAEAREMPGHLVHVGEKQLPCESCHELTNDGSAVARMDRPSMERCVVCHESQSRIEHGPRPESTESTLADCTSCHAFVPEQLTALPADWVEHHQLPDGGALDTAWACSRCHGDAAATGRVLTTHATADCSRCHTPHGVPSASPADCQQCHENIRSTHGASLGDVAADCSRCHDSMHTPARAAAEGCRKCHAEGEPRVPPSATFLTGPGRGHETCQTCHRPHEFSAATATPCAGCHSNHSALSAESVPAHAQCASCHSPHQVGGAKDACQGCHQKVATDHPGRPWSGACVACHPAHPVANKAAGTGSLEPPHQLATPCTSCHRSHAPGGVAHGAGLACVSCHRPHQFKVNKVDPALCSKCHTAQASGVITRPGHAACAACHTSDVHAMAKPRPCGECHSAQLQALVSADVHQAQGLECESCHEVHSGALVKQCVACHSEQRRTAPPGHQDCLACHEQHSTGLKLEAQRCENCHASKADALHNDVPGSCGSCHRPHGPRGPAKTPSCDSCHRADTLTGLHLVAEHRTCDQCHSGHQKRIAGSGACLTCHEKQRHDHFPTASDCASCHLFRAGRAAQ